MLGIRSQNRTLLRRRGLAASVAGLLVAIAAPAAEAPPADSGTVTAGKLNVRARPGRQYEVVCQLRRGSAVNIRERQGDWLGIQVPESAIAWVPSTALDGERVTVSRTPVYSGASAVYSSYAHLSRGDTVKVLETRDDKWVRVTPPPDATVWVHSSFVECPEPPAAPPPTGSDVATQPPDEPEGPPAAADDSVDGKPDTVPAPMPAPTEIKIHRIAAQPPSEDELHFIGDARPVERSGIVIPLGDAASQWAYALAVLVNDTYYPLAYLDRSAGDLATWKWHEVTVSGTQRWVKGWPRPLIQIATIQRRLAHGDGADAPETP